MRDRQMTRREGGKRTVRGRYTEGGSSEGAI